MAASPPSSLLIPPSSSSNPPAPPTSQPNATSDPPASSPPAPPVGAPPPSVPSPPPITSAAPPQPPAVASPPPVSNDAPPPSSPSPPPPTPTSPPPSAPPPAPPLSPPPTPLPPPASTPPPAALPPVTVPPPPPVDPGSPPPAPAAVPVPPTSPSQPPPSTAPPPAQPPPSPVDSPPPAVSQSPPPPSVPATPPSPSAPPPENPTPSDPSAPPPEKPTPSDPSAPPPKDQPPPVPSPPSPSPSNSSNGTTPTPFVPSPPGRVPPPILTPTTPPGDPLTPSNSSPEISQSGSSAGGGGAKTGTVAAVVVVGLLVLSLVGVAAWFFKKKRRRNAGGYAAGFVAPSPFSSSQMSDSSNPRSPATAPLVYNSYGSHGFINSPPNQGLGNSKLLFTYEHLHQITDGFSSKNLLGEGGFGCVYKGNLPDGREVAVKQLKVGGGQGEREFTAEVETISRVHHRNLVSLVGYCMAQNQRLLVYDYVPNNTLHYHIHEGSTVMDWATRVKVAVGAAHGIAYLHEDCHPRIIHRDIKSSNILLDNNFEAQVSDFGLAKLTLDAATHVTTRVMGTFGYMAPEYASTGKLTDRSDVYSFGVVLLELITGRVPVDQSQPLGDESLVEWARPLLTHALDSRDFEGLPDPRLEKNYNERELLRMIEAAAACVRHSASMRPKMGLVVRALDSLTESDLNNGIVPGRSEQYSAPRSTEVRMFQRMAFGSQDYSIDFSGTSVASRDDL